MSGATIGRTAARRALARSVGALVLAVVLPAGLCAQGAGSAATTLLRLAPTPASLALGNAVTALAGADAIEYNPAALDGPATIAAAYEALPVDIGAGSMLAVVPAGGFTLGASLRYLDYGDVRVLEAAPGGLVGQPTGGEVGGGEASALLAASVRLGRLSVGAGGRWLRQDVAELRGTTFSADVGALLTVLPGLRLGASVQHLGDDLEAGRPAPLPTTVRVGAAATGSAGPIELGAVADVREREDRRTLGVGIQLGAGRPGLEGVLRLGYEQRASDEDVYSPVVVGGGLTLGRLTVDLAWRALGALGSTRVLGARYTF